MMQSLRLVFRRAYSTKPPTSLPEAARVARTASTPLAVRLRRAKKFGPTEPGTSDSTLEGLTPTEKARYDRLRAKGEIADVNGREVTAGEWLQRISTRRSRVRGLRTVRLNGEKGLQVVGQRVYLPNIIFRLVRNNTSLGEPYNPYEATFRVPKSVTKTDIRSYLLAIYGVQTTYIRTDNYIAPEPSRGRQRKTFRTFKRAVVGLVDPFYYPLRLEDMEAEERSRRENWIEENFRIQETRTMQKYELLRLTKGQAKGWKFNEPFATKRSHILRLVAERREKRENLIAGQVAEWQEMRAKGEPIVLDAPKSPTETSSAN